jgi:hypothetical protein
MIGLAIWVLIGCLVLYCIWLFIGMLQLPAQAKQIICVVISIIFLLLLLQKLGLVDANWP